MLQMATGITSIQTDLQTNTLEASHALRHWVEHGTFDDLKIGPKEGTGNLQLKSTPFSLAGPPRALKAMNLKIVERLTKEKGSVSKAAEHLIEPVTAKELHEFNKEMGYKGSVGDIGAIRELVQQATGQQEMIPRAFIFGKKVGAYTLDHLGQHQYNTVDRWEARFIRSQFKGMFKKNFNLPDNVDEHTVFTKFTDAFNEEFKKETGVEWENSALQAARWFYILDAVRESGYTKARTSESISEYTKGAIDLRGADQTRGPPSNAEGGKGSFLDRQEAAARQRIAGRRGRLNTGIDPSSLVDEAIIGAAHIARGIKAFPEWSERMIKDIGDWVEPHLKTIWKESKKMSAAVQQGKRGPLSEEQRLEAAIKRSEASTKAIRAKIDAGDITRNARPAPIVPNERLRKAQGDLQRARDDFNTLFAKAQRDAMPKWKKAADNVVRGTRALKLAGVKIFGKLGGAAATRLAMEEVEHAVSAIIGEVLRPVGRMAPEYGRTGFGPRATAAAAKGFVKGIKDIPTILRGKRTDAEAEFGKHHVEYTVGPKIFDYPGRAHAAEAAGEGIG